MFFLYHISNHSKKNLTQLFFVIFFLFPILSFSQNIHYARFVIDSLCSPNMHGRGYVADGDRKAAVFIKEQFAQLGLKTFNGTYFQHFSFPVNSFPGNMKVKINNQELVPGAEYIVDPASRGIIGSFEVITWKPGIKKKQCKNKFLLVPEKKAFKEVKIPARAKGVLIIDPKTLGSSVSVFTQTTGIIVKDSLLKETPAHIEVDIQNKFIDNHSTQNVLGYIEGSLYPDSFIVFSAHYDHLGRMGREVYFPGANDNASGIAMLLNLASYYSAPGNRPAYSIAFIAFAGEEAGLLGSKYYVANPVFALSNISFLLNMDIMGTGDDGIQVVNGSVHQDLFDSLCHINKTQHYLPEIKIRGKAANSDHYWFSQKGIRSFFIYTLGGIKAYHDIYDRPETLPLTEFEDTFRLIVEFEKLLETPARYK